MKITAISSQTKNDSRVNVSVDGEYGFSLDIGQLVELGLRVGKDVTKKDIENYIAESEFGKLYGRALKYCLVRPRSLREVKNYLSRRIWDKRGVDSIVFEKNASRVLDRLIDRGYVDDRKFASFWIENRMQRKGISRRKLTMELKNKGIEDSVIAGAVNSTNRNDVDELKKVIERKRNKYDDERKLIRYLVSLGFDYNDVRESVKLKLE